jgi:hypothetical protein
VDATAEGKKRRRYQTTSAAGVMQFLNRRGISAACTRSEVLGRRWVVLINSHTIEEANAVRRALQHNGYNLLGQFGEWVVVAEDQKTDKENV